MLKILDYAMLHCSRNVPIMLNYCANYAQELSIMLKLFRFLQWHWEADGFVL